MKVSNNIDFCALVSRPNAKPQTVSGQAKTTPTTEENYPTNGK